MTQNNESSLSSVVFNRYATNDSENDQLHHEDIWDDTLLIQQYDEAMENARKQLASKLNSASSISDSDVSVRLTVNKENVVNGKPYQSSHIKKKKKKNKKKNEWHTGDPCRSQFSGDGEIYEATIVGMNNTSGTCTVRYIGYNNHEEVALSSLLKSRGVRARKRQINAIAEAYSQSEDATEDSCTAESDSAMDIEQGKKTRRNRNHYTNITSMPPPSQDTVSGPSSSIPHLPNLPPPPALGLVDADDSVSSEALHTMLMSWYMTGYHTGYYQGLTHGRNAVKHNSGNRTTHNHGK